jgi:hypothetical protein
MAWIRITEKFSWIATPATTIVYKPGVYQVTFACATLAIAAGKAVRLRKTNRDSEPVEEAAMAEGDGG